MATNRAFFSLEWVDRRLADGRIGLEGEVLVLDPRVPESAAFRLRSAVLFRSEVSTGEDARRLCGRVKTLAAVSELSGEHAPGSVIVGDHAYEVLDGFIGELIAPKDAAAAELVEEHAGTAALIQLKTLTRMDLK